MQQAGLHSHERFLLYFCAAFGGASILAIEIVGARILTPYFGSSHFVWTAQITVTLLALAFGYWMGGRATHKEPSRFLAIAWILGASWIALSPLLVRLVSMVCVRLESPVGALCASGLLFFVPLSLFASLGPIFVFLLSSEIASVGTVAGRLSSISTLGSAFGAVAAGYPSFPNQFVLAWIGVILLAISWFLLRSFHPTIRLVIFPATGVIMAVGLLGSQRFAEWKFQHAAELERVNSPFGLIQVLDLPDSSTRLYLNDFLVVNTYDTKRRQGQDVYTHLLGLLAQSYTPHLRDVLCIGMAAGIVPMDLSKAGVQVLAIEINPVAVQQAVKYFDFDTNKVQVIIQDGRYVLNRTPRRFDVVVLDAYMGESAPRHLLCKEAFQAMRRVLKPGGALIMSSATSSDGSSAFFLASVRKTLEQVFRHARIHDTGLGTICFVASDTPLNPIVVSLDQVPPDIRAIVQKTLQSNLRIDLSQGVVITDDFNPLDYYEAGNRQTIRHRILDRIRTL